MANIVMAWAGYKTHIIDNSPNNSEPVKTRCGRTIKQYQLGYFGVEDCPKCGSPEDYKEVGRQLSEENTRKEALRKEQMEKAREREEMATKQRKDIASRIADTIVENLDSKILQVENWARCDNYILEIEGHKFVVKPVL